MRTVALILFAGVLLSACERRPVQSDLPKSEGNSVDHSGRHGSVIKTSPNAASARYELQFLDTMIAHHETVIDLAQLAQTRAGHVELKNLARKMIEDQRKEIEKLRGLRGKFFSSAATAINAELPGIGDSMKNLDPEKLDNLKETPFDLEFIRQMTALHTGSITMAEDALGREQDGSDSIELTGSIGQLARSIIDIETGEIRQMGEWQTAWAK